MNRFLLLLLLLAPFALLAGSWQYHPYADNYRRVLCAGDDLFVLKGNRLLMANGPRWELTGELNRENGLSSYEIADIAYSTTSRKTAIVYADGNIDLLRPDGTTICLTELNETPYAGHSKHINRVLMSNEMLCVSTDYGFMIIDPAAEVILYSITTDLPVLYTWIDRNHYYYRNNAGNTFRCPLTGNLYNPQSWSRTFQQPPTVIVPAGANDQCASVTGDTIYTLYPDQGLVSSVRDEALDLGRQQQGGNNNRLHYAHDLLSTCHVSDLVFYGYNANLTTQGYLSEYNPATQQWSNMTHNAVTGNLSERKTFGGIMDMIPDPSTPRRYYYSSLENGIYVIQNNTLNKRWDNFDKTALIEAFSGNSARVGGLAFSPQNDLWFVNEGVNEMLRVRTHTGKWYKFAIQGCAGQTSLPHLFHSRHSDKKMLWGCKVTGYQKGLVFAYDYAGTLTDTKDDRSITLQKFTDEEGRTIHPYYFYNVAEGPDGAIWILTTSGIYVIDTPEQVFDEPGRVRTAFDGLKANTLLFDPEGRLWIGTTGEGIYLYDPSAKHQLAHFTTDNCLLTSNEVLALAFDETSHTLWISCLDGILAYHYEVDEHSLPFASAAYCQPGNVPAGSQEPIHIIGLADGTSVSILNAHDELVHTAHAIGGTVTLPSQLFATGSYNVSGTDSEGHQGVVATFRVE